MEIWKRILFVTASFIVVAWCADTYHVYKDARASAVESLLTQAEKIRGVIMATRRVYHQQFLDSKIPLTDETLGFLPAHALSKISKDFGNWDSSGVHFNNVTDQPRNPDNKADADEMKAIDFFRKDSSQSLYFQPFQNEKAEPFYLYARPLRIEAYCLNCHGKRESAPPTIRDNYITSFDYKVGDLRGILSIKLPARSIDTLVMKEFVRELRTHVVFFIGMFFIIFYAVRKYVKQPLGHISDGMEKIASGDYSSRLAGFEGELADIEFSFNTMVEEIAKQRALTTHSKDEAEKASKAKSEFLASMSHELRTPMNAVLGFAQMLQFDPQNPLSPVQNERVESILAGGNFLLKQVNQILDLAKIEADQISLSLNELNVDEVADSCIKLIRPLGEPKGITFSNTHSDKPLPLVRTDPNRLKQILLNLLSNAVKFNNPGGTVTVEGQETDDGFLRISVTDTGQGIAREDYSGVFELFNQLNANPVIAHEGIGIGLPVTKMLVERLSGRIGFDSEKGVGTTFWFELPLASNKDVLIWTDDLRIGIDALDRDHQTIFLLANKLSYSSIDDNEVNDVIWKLIDYTHYHFRREEAVMEACGCPELNQQRNSHKALSLQVHQLSESWRRDQNPQTLRQLCKFMHDLLLNHIMTEDVKIIPYAQGKGVEITQALEAIKAQDTKLTSQS